MNFPEAAKYRICSRINRAMGEGGELGTWDGGGIEVSFGLGLIDNGWGVEYRIGMRLCF